MFLNIYQKTGKIIVNDITYVIDRDHNATSQFANDIINGITIKNTNIELRNDAIKEPFIFFVEFKNPNIISRKPKIIVEDSITLIA